MNKQEISFFWFRRDLRLEDNVGLFFALESKYPVIPLFIFDEAILDSLPKNDARVGFIDESIRNKSLLELKKLLKWVVNKYPDVEFMGMDSLQKLILK